MEHKTLKVTVKQIGPESDRVLRFLGSDESVDRDSDIIEVAGWDLNNYLRNPVVLWSHDGYSTPPIGKTVTLNKDLANKQLIFDIKFPTLSEMSTDAENISDHAKFVDTVYNMCKNGYLNAVSVGFHGTKFKRRDDPDSLELSEWQRGMLYIEQELFEISVCSIPSNPNALQAAKSKGLIDDKTIKSFFDAPKQKESEVNFMLNEKSGAKLSEDSKKVLSDIQTKLSDGMSAHKAAHKTAIDAYKAVADGLDGNGKDDMTKAIDAHEAAHKEAVKCYKECTASLKKFIDPDSPDDTGMQQQDGGTSDGVERAISELSEEVKALTDLVKGKQLTPPAANTDDIDLDNIPGEDLAKMFDKIVEEKLKAVTGKI